MPLKIFNNLTRKKEVFESLRPKKVGMYVCGVTVYDECHLGHARAAVVFDVVYRYLKYLGYEVIYVRNFTDVDDKIIKKSLDSGEPWQSITERYMQSYQEQMRRLGVLPPDFEPKATEHVTEMKGLIQTLISKGLAYPSGSDVFFRVRNFPGYGRLSHKKIDDLESGARVEVDEKKEDPLDFTLWKGAKPGEPHWESPWGDGRPGWHIECSAMGLKLLGRQFDIHGGGRDLMFPHHENEIAQSEAATGHSPFARFWIHNGFVNIHAEKMGKSQGNLMTVLQILEQWDHEVVRFFLLSAHYASPLDFTSQAMMNAQESLTRIYETLSRLEQAPKGRGSMSIDFDRMIRKGMDDDFNTPLVLGDFFRFVREMNAQLDKQNGWREDNRDQILRDLKEVMGKTLGILASDPQGFLGRQKERALKASLMDPDEIERLIEERRRARQAKDFKRSDEIRQELASKGVLLKDNPDGTTVWNLC